MKHEVFGIMVGVLLLFTIIGFAQGYFPERQNVVFIVDMEEIESPWLRRTVLEILDKVPLTENRIALYSTNGLSQPILQFRSRNCSAKILKNTGKYIPLLEVIDQVKKDLKNFTDDENVIVIITQQMYIKTIQSKLNAISTSGIRNKENYIIQFAFPLKNGIIDNILWKSDQTGTWVWKDNPKVKMSEIFHWLDFVKADLNTCDGNFWKYTKDECNRRCECQNGRLVNCYRVREHFSSLPLSKRQQYIDAYKRLASHSSFNRYFYQILRVHNEVDFTILHARPQLVAFHRKITVDIESMLRLIDCRITIPFWNFPLYKNPLNESHPGYHMWDSVGGFGSTKTNLENGGCIGTGPFAYPNFEYPAFFADSLNNTERFINYCTVNLDKGKQYHNKTCETVLKNYFNPYCLTRSLNIHQHVVEYRQTYEQLHNLTASFDDFEYYLRDNAHSPIHNNIAGDMGGGLASTMPEFFPFHSYIDAMWTFWQDRNPGSNVAWIEDKETQLIGFNVPRYLYCDNDNLEECGLKITYTSIFPIHPNDHK